MLPYSIYSISILELSNLRIPLYFPTDELIIQLGLLKDVRLHPLYADKDAVMSFEVLNCNEVANPNCDCFSCQIHWLKFAYWKDLDNVIYWTSVEDLASKLKIISLEGSSVTTTDSNVALFKNFLPNL